MKFRCYLAPLLLAITLLLQPGCGNAPAPLPEGDSGEVDDMMEEMTVPEPE